MELEWSWKIVLDAATLLGIPSLILTIIFFIVSRSKFGLAFRPYEKLVIGNENAEIADGLQIIYKNKEIKSLLRTELFVWNNGNRPIRGTDIARNDMVRVLYVGGSPLSVQLLRSSSAANAVRFVESDMPKCAAIDFDYLEPNEGFVVEILHEEDLAIQVHGKVVGGAGSGISDFSPRRNSKSALAKALDFVADSITGKIFLGGRRYLIVWVIWTAYTLFFPVFFYFAPPPRRGDHIEPERFALIMFGVLFPAWIALSIGVWRRMRREPPSDLIGDVVPRK
jgi:hypothetical protein